MQRRRFIQIMASSIAGLGLGQTLSARSLQPVSWQGYALGSEGQFTLYTEQPTQARRILDTCLAEIRHLESRFSLYDSQSELCQLNRNGSLSNPAPEWQPLLRAIDQAYQQTNGLFDPTIQPIWKHYQAHFAAQPQATTVPDEGTLQAALARTGWQHVQHNESGVHFKQPSMSLTLNGIAQGYITDRIAEILQAAGYGQVLIELGETRGLGQHPEQRPWQIGIQDANNRQNIYRIAELENQALATSGGYGSPFSQDGTYHHLIHPQTGRPTTQWKSLSVIAPSATQADALSTGLSFASPSQIQQFQQTHDQVQILTQA
ncbi:FAD:protein FMN transferase [Coraliomargarita algicola]|uniref:FAD:protein FMN transferase n=1 Tax=Coraliomargarita algicola TaxID=3092156 RepID=A0ABZ0RN30_9BACT|nr:FAD:protein FMN transferase [Coraliomargarita sp. J2-16]WPJ97634.1 FAD:protein FMN transferase [Coraliomargarita sp. J2-16]